jgi:two-component system CheB/CheR fusion protein
MPTTVLDPRPTGIRALGELPWGSHFGVFYASTRELLEVLVPFVQAGLQCNELCSWEVEPPLTVDEATAALARAVPDLERYVERGQLEIAALPQCAPQAPLDELLEARLDRGILEGFDGMRLVARGGAGARAAADIVRRLHVVAAFPYARAALGGGVELMERVQDHRFALVCNSGQWEVLSGSAAHSARDELCPGEDQLQSLFRNMSEGFAYHRIVRDAQGKPCDYVFLHVNPAFERLTGLAAADVVGKRVTQVIPQIGRDPTDWIGKYGHVALTGRPMQFESHAVALDHWYAVSAFSSQKGYFAVTFSDITDRKRADARRRTSEARFKLLSDSASLLLSTDDPQGVVSDLCREVMEHLDCQVFLNFLADAAEEVLHLHASAGVPDAEARALERLDFGTAVSGRVARDRKRVIAEDVQRSSDPATERLRSLGVQAYCCHPLLAGGHLLGTLSFGTKTRASFSAEDVGLMKTVADEVASAMERIQSKRVLHDANRRLQEADRRKDEFLALLSHELRNPLSPIQNGLYILDRAAPGGEQATRALQVIRRQVGHLRRIVDDLLDVTRIARGKARLQRERLDLAEVVRRTVDDYRASFAEGGIRLDAHLPDAALWADADATRVAQIVGNLLVNALKFTPRGGAVRLTLAEEGGAAVLRVRDSGAGIAPEILERLFQPFAQADETLDRSRGGLGLGLALVRGLAELHGGSAAGASEGPGRGAEFTVRLPLQVAPHRPAAVAAPPASQPRRVLIVEDSVDGADSLKEVLELWGHEVSVAHDGPAGIAAARALRPEIVLCDIGLPGMSGYAVASALRADAALAGICLVALTGYASPDDVRRATEAGFDHHLSKPPSFLALGELLATARAASAPSLAVPAHTA